jgi:hypothetical protein
MSTNVFREHTIEANNTIEKQARQQNNISHAEKWTVGPIAVLDCPNCGLNDNWYGTHSERNPEGNISCQDCDYNATMRQATLFEIENRRVDK